MYAVPSESDFVRSKEVINDDFLVFYGILLLLLQAGLACIEASRIKPKHAPSIFLKIFLHILICCFMYWLIGYCLSYSKGNFFLGYNGWNFITNQTAVTPQWLFDSLVSTTPVTIISGVVLERGNPIAFLILSVIISGAIHPMSIHWVWTSEGWLNCLGYTDFSGAGVIFAFAGIGSFITSLMLGPRKARFSENSEVTPIHSASLLGTGAILSTIGLLMLNCGSLYRTFTNVEAATLNKVIQNTILAGAAACIISLIIGRLRVQQPAWLLGNVINGSLAGMVAICGAVQAYNGLEAVAIGIIAGFVFTALHYILLLLKIDDPIDACPVYFGGGVWGILAGKIFTSNGILESKNFNDNAWFLLINFTGVMAICLWSIIWTIASILIIKGIEKMGEKEEPEAQADLNLNSYEDDSCYIEALPYPQTVNNDKMRTERDEYISHFNNSTLRILKMDSNLYENMGLGMELQMRSSRDQNDSII